VENQQQDLPAKHYRGKIKKDDTVGRQKNKKNDNRIQKWSSHEVSRRAASQD